VSGLEPGDDARGGLLGSLRALLATLVAIGHNRLELFSTEVQEEVERVASMLLWSAVALLLGLLALLSASVAIILAVPPERQWLAASILAGLFLAACAWAAIVARGRMTMKRRPFDATLGELAKDHDVLSR
jgi:uncharacterized membrane protein YqjE